MTNIIDKNALVKKMDERQAALLKLVERDITGNTLAVLEAWRECKYWKEAIIRESLILNYGKINYFPLYLTVIE